MNPKLLLFSGLVSMVSGAASLGFVLATLLPTPFRGGIYLNQKPGYMLLGAMGGFLFGVSIEALRELKEQRDHEDS